MAEILGLSYKTDEDRYVSFIPDIFANAPLCVDSDGKLNLAYDSATLSVDSNDKLTVIGGGSAEVSGTFPVSVDDENVVSLNYDTTAGLKSDATKGLQVAIDTDNLKFSSGKVSYIRDASVKSHINSIKTLDASMKKADSSIKLLDASAGAHDSSIKTLDASVKLIDGSLNGMSFKVVTAIPTVFDVNTLYIVTE